MTIGTRSASAPLAFALLASLAGCGGGDNGGQAAPSGWTFAPEPAPPAPSGWEFKSEPTPPAPPAVPEADQQWVGNWVWDVNIAIHAVARPTEVRLRYDEVSRQLAGTWFEDSGTDAGRWSGKLVEIKAEGSALTFTVEEVKFLGFSQVPRSQFKLEKGAAGGDAGKLYRQVKGAWREEFAMKRSS